MLPPDVRVARDAQDLLIECCVGELIMEYHGFYMTSIFFFMSHINQMNFFFPNQYMLLKFLSQLVTCAIIPLHTE